MRGIALALYAPDREDPALPFGAQIDEIAAAGASHVALVVSWSQADVRASAVAPRAGVTLPDDRLRALVRAAHRAGLKAVVFPILDVRARAAGQWRGTVAPADLDAWWGSYERFILHYADLAAAEQAEALVVGSELSSTEAWRDRWYHLIGRVERRYRGALVYSANWDHYQAVSFWPRVDYLGVTGYFELTRDRDAGEEELTAAWAEARDRLTVFAAAHERPLWITEVGYTSQDGAATQPWNYARGAALDLEEQRRCYAAFAAAWGGQPGLAGVFVWNWLGAGGPRDTDYTPRGKPAEQVLRGWFAAAAR